MPALHIMDELMNFITFEGKDQALSGKFDDHVMMLAMALALKSGATRYVIPRWKGPLPPEVERYERQRARGAMSGGRVCPFNHP